MKRIDKKEKSTNDKDIKRKGRSDTGKPLDKVDTTPTLQIEAKGSSVAFAFGRMNPVTIGHEKLVNKLKQVAKASRTTPLLFLSHSSDKKKNPLKYDQKIGFAQNAFGQNIVRRSLSRTIIEIMKELEKDYDSVILVAGSDRVAEFEKLLKTYNGKEYNFSSIKVVSAGGRDPDADGVSGMSASKMRLAAAQGDYEAFKKGVPIGIDAQLMYDTLRDQMNVKEAISEAVLTMQQRLQRKQSMRRIKARIQRGRKIAKKKLATKEKLERRADRKARSILRARLAGSQGENYDDLSYGAKIQVDKKLEKKAGLIKKLAKRLLPKVRKAELQRFALARGGDTNEDTNYNLIKIALKKKQNAERITLQRRQNKERERVQVRNIVRKKAGLRREETLHVSDDQEILRVVERFLEDIHRYDLDESVVKNLRKKSEKNDIPLDTLKEVYIRGVLSYNDDVKLSEEQYAFNRVNSFINGGRAMREDMDLIEAKHTYDWNALKQVTPLIKSDRQRQRFTDAVDYMMRAIEDKEAWNSEFNDHKTYGLSRTLEDVYREVMSQYMEKLRATEFKDDPDSMFGLVSIKKLDKHWQSKARDYPEMAKFMSYVREVPDIIKEVKTYIKKGRKPAPVDPNKFVRPIASREAVKQVSDLLSRTIESTRVKLTDDRRDNMLAIVDRYKNTELTQSKVMKIKDGYDKHIVSRVFRSVRYGQPLVLAADWQKIIDDLAEREARNIVDGFIGKNTLKLSNVVQKKDAIARHKIFFTNVRNGNLENKMRFEFTDGSAFSVHSKTIYGWRNGRFYIQYPTRFMDVVLADGTRMKSPSEEKMIKEF